MYLYNLSHSYCNAIATLKLKTECYVQLKKEPIWWYHPDHLGSSSYLTDYTGTPSHYYNYLPFGEEMVSQNTSSYNNVYRFSGKELDEETGLSYFGARYYNPKWSIWLSVDPLAEKFPAWSPYNFVFNNPIRFIDPDGMEPEDHWKILKNGTAQRVDTKGDGIFIKHEGDRDYQSLKNFNFLDNAKAFNNVVSHYGKASGYKGSFLTLSFKGGKLDSSTSYNVSEEIHNYSTNKKISAMAAYPEAYSAEQFGIMTYLKNGIVSDPAIYETKHTLISAIVHEKRHLDDNFSAGYGFNYELNAIISQINHSSWSKLEGTKFKIDTLNYAKANYDRLSNEIGWKNTPNGKAWLKIYKCTFNF